MSQQVQHERPDYDETSEEDAAIARADSLAPIIDRIEDEVFR